MDGEISESLDHLIQLGRDAEAVSIKVGVIHSRTARLKKYPEGAFDKYRKTFKKMREIVDAIGEQANKISDKLWDIYYEDLRERYPDIDWNTGNRKPRKLVADDGSAIDLTSTKRPRRVKKPKPKKEKFSMEDMLD